MVYEALVCGKIGKDGGKLVYKNRKKPETRPFCVMLWNLDYFFVNTNANKYQHNIYQYIYKYQYNNNTDTNN